MKIELKNLKINATFSRETILFQADVWVNGVKTAYASNDGHGGCTDYHAHEGKRELLAQAEAYVKTLPDEVVNFMGKTMVIPRNLENMIDNIVTTKFNDNEKAKFNKKLEKHCVGNICWGVPDGDGYKMRGFGAKGNLADMMKTPSGKAKVEQIIKDVQAKLEKDEVILNKNIPI
jgi:hypothetical protein